MEFKENTGHIYNIRVNKHKVAFKIRADISPKQYSVLHGVNRSPRHR